MFSTMWALLLRTSRFYLLARFTNSLSSTLILTVLVVLSTVFLTGVACASVKPRTASNPQTRCRQRSTSEPEAWRLLGWVDAWVGGQMGGLVDWMDWWMNGQADGLACLLAGWLDSVRPPGAPLAGYPPLKNRGFGVIRRSQDTSWRIGLILHRMLIHVYYYM